MDLRDLDGTLDSLEVARKVVLDPTTHTDEIAAVPGMTGWVDTPRRRKGFPVVWALLVAWPGPRAPEI